MNTPKPTNVMCQATIEVARAIRDLDSIELDEHDGVRRVVVFDFELADELGFDVKKLRAGLLDLERLGCISAEDLLPGRSSKPKGRGVVINLAHDAWAWLEAYDLLDAAYQQMFEVA